MTRPSERRPVCCICDKPIQGVPRKHPVHGEPVHGDCLRIMDEHFNSIAEVHELDMHAEMRG